MENKALTYTQGNSLMMVFKLFIFLYNTVLVVAEICAQNNSDFRVKKILSYPIGHLMYMDFTAVVHLHPNTPHTAAVSQWHQMGSNWRILDRYLSSRLGKGKARKAEEAGPTAPPQSGDTDVMASQ